MICGSEGGGGGGVGVEVTSATATTATAIGTTTGTQLTADTVMTSHEPEVLTVNTSDLTEVVSGTHTTSGSRTRAAPLARTTRRLLRGHTAQTTTVLILKKYIF
uniref:Uncharacterized protein n=1 Tax=Glossina pallidipes TaxID=7398 RepID=A0A1B0A297_GLOPL